MAWTEKRQHDQQQERGHNLTLSKQLLYLNLYGPALVLLPQHKALHIVGVQKYLLIEMGLNPDSFPH